MAGLRPLFNARMIRETMDNFREEAMAKTVERFQYLGELFVNKARLDGNYKDRTANLRSSIGYIILIDGEVHENNFDGTNEGTSKGQKFANEVAEQYPDGIVLIGVAGMEYSALVEAKGYDVITGSAPTKALLKSVLDEI